MPLLIETTKQIDIDPEVHKHDEWIETNQFYIILLATFIIYILRKPLLYLIGLFIKLSLFLTILYFGYKLL
jgi:hypothetical protein